MEEEQRAQSTGVAVATGWHLVSQYGLLKSPCRADNLSNSTTAVTASGGPVAVPGGVTLSHCFRVQSVCANILSFSYITEATKIQATMAFTP